MQPHAIAMLSKSAPDRGAGKNVAQLRAGAMGMGGGLDVDEAAGIIRNAAVITVGPAMGHPFACDAVTIAQVAELINAAGGVKVRFKHPGKVREPDGRIVMSDDAGSVVGQLLAPVRIEGDCVRGDIKIHDAAAHLPGQGDARSYLLAMAREAPADIGLSVVMVWAPEIVGGQAFARVSDVWAADLVGMPAANPNGLLSAGIAGDGEGDRGDSAGGGTGGTTQNNNAGASPAQSQVAGDQPGKGVRPPPPPAFLADASRRHGFLTSTK